MRKQYLSLVIAFAALFLCGCIGSSTSSFLRTNWNVVIPEPKKETVIYSIEFREGNEFEVWEFGEDGLSAIKSSEQFTEISDSNIAEVKELLEFQYEAATEEEQIKFNENFSIDTTLKTGDFFCHRIRDKGIIADEDELLIYVDSSTGIVYYMTDVW